MRKLVTVISKSGCGLCEKVIATLEAMSSCCELDVRVLYIDDDPKLHDRYWLTVPAVQIDGKDAFDARHIGGDAGYAVMLEELLKAYESTATSS